MHLEVVERPKKKAKKSNPAAPAAPGLKGAERREYVLQGRRWVQDSARIKGVLPSLAEQLPFICISEETKEHPADRGRVHVVELLGRAESHMTKQERDAHDCQKAVDAILPQYWRQLTMQRITSQWHNWCGSLRSS